MKHVKETSRPEDDDMKRLVMEYLLTKSKHYLRTKRLIKEDKKKCREEFVTFKFRAGTNFQLPPIGCADIFTHLRIVTNQIGDSFGAEAHSCGVEESSGSRPF